MVFVIGGEGGSHATAHVIGEGVVRETVVRHDDSRLARAVAYSVAEDMGIRSI